jgi:hypothetical protein
MWIKTMPDINILDRAKMLLITLAEREDPDAKLNAIAVEINRSYTRGLLEARDLYLGDT